MKATDIIALATAGYTAEQIAVIAKAAKEQTAQQPEPASQPEPAPQEEARPDMLAQILERFDTMTQAMQANAILGTPQPPRQTADDILAEIIRPPKRSDNIW